MLSKSTLAATLLLAFAACRSLPWADEQPRVEVNLVFRMENNLVFLPTVLVDGQSGRFLLATAAQATVVDPAFPLGRASRSTLTVSDKETMRFVPRRVALSGVADAMIGADVWGRHALTIDYVSGLVTYQKEGIYPEYMSLYRYEQEPMVTVLVDGIKMGAIVDTSSPDTLVLPRATEGRGTARVLVGATDFGSIDVAYANVQRARIGNRLLSRFLVTIDYGQRVVGLWRDPRVPV
jgi:hypothetical protein